MFFWPNVDFSHFCPVGMSVGDARIDSSVGTGLLAFRGDGRWVWRSALFSTGVPVIRGIRGAGCPQGGWFRPKKMYELKLSGCHRFTKRMAEGSPELFFFGGNVQFVIWYVRIDPDSNFLKNISHCIS